MPVYDARIYALTSIQTEERRDGGKSPARSRNRQRLKFKFKFKLALTLLSARLSVD